MPTKEDDICLQHHQPFINCTVYHRNKSNQHRHSQSDSTNCQENVQHFANSKGHSPRGVINSSQGEKVTSSQACKTKPQTIFCMQAINARVDTKEKKSPEEKVCRSYQIYLNNSSEIISIVHLDQNQGTKDIYLETFHYNPKLNH